MVFALLSKVVIFHMRPITRDFGGPGLEGFFSSSFPWCLSLENYSNDLLEVLFGILSHVICGSLWESSSKFNWRFI